VEIGGGTTPVLAKVCKVFEIVGLELDFGSLFVLFEGDLEVVKLSAH
jgi:hypothetical protein